MWDCKNFVFFFSSRRRHTRFDCDWSSDVCSSDLADVVLKERRRLVLMVRETPLHTGHLQTMAALSQIGAVIAPPVPAFYAKPQTIAEMIDQTLGRVLDLFGLDSGTVRR